jgi:hypothetical protein
LDKKDIFVLIKRTFNEHKRFDTNAANINATVVNTDRNLFVLLTIQTIWLKKK